MQASNIILINEFGTSTIRIPTIATDKLEPSGDGVLVLYDFDDDICPIVNSSNTSPFHFRNVTPSLSKVLVDIIKTYYIVPCI